MQSLSGKMVGMTIGGLYVACETSCELNFSKEMLPVTSISSGTWREFLAGLSSWTMTFNSNAVLNTTGANIRLILTSFINGTLLDVTIQTKFPDITGVFTVSGKAFVNSGTFSAPSTGSATLNTMFQGSGPLTVI